jgi:hypothetical protein
MMIYIKSILAGTGLLIGCVALFTFALFTINIDLRAIMGHFPFISLPIMLAIFVVGFLWQFRRTSKG